VGYTSGARSQEPGARSQEPGARSQNTGVGIELKNFRSNAWIRILKYLFLFSFLNSKVLLVALFE
jgi:hypothetical protein